MPVTAKPSLNVKRLALIGVLIALFVVLGFVAVDLRVMKISFSGLPVIIGALLMGPLAGTEIGLIGELIAQLLRYGITVTTPIWIIPPAVRGLMVGLYAKKYDYRLSTRQLAFIMILSSIVVTLLNTVGIYIDSHIYGYYNFATVFGALLVRILNGVLSSIVYLVIVPYVIKRLAPYTGEIRRQASSL